MSIHDGCRALSQREPQLKNSIEMKTNIINNNVQTMTSLEIAELTGKQHKDLMKAIRKMEPAWEKVHGRKFALMFREVTIEARAKLVLRWQELELAEQKRRQQLCLPSPQKILALADNIIGEGLRLVNADAEDTLTATQVAKTFNMTTLDFNAVLRDMGIQYRRGGHWNICDDLVDRDFVRMRTHVSYSLKGVKKVKVYMTWTLDGLRYLNSKLGYPNF